MSRSRSPSFPTRRSPPTPSHRVVNTAAPRAFTRAHSERQLSPPSPKAAEPQPLSLAHRIMTTTAAPPRAFAKPHPERRFSPPSPAQSPTSPKSPAVVPRVRNISYPRGTSPKAAPAPRSARLSLPASSTPTFKSSPRTSSPSTVFLWRSNSSTPSGYSGSGKAMRRDRAPPPAVSSPTYTGPAARTRPGSGPADAAMYVAPRPRSGYATRSPAATGRTSPAPGPRSASPRHLLSAPSPPAPPRSRAAPPPPPRSHTPPPSPAGPLPQSPAAVSRSPVRTRPTTPANAPRAIPRARTASPPHALPHRPPHLQPLSPLRPPSTPPPPPAQRQPPTPSSVRRRTPPPAQPPSPASLSSPWPQSPASALPPSPPAPEPPSSPPPQSPPSPPIPPESLWPEPMLPQAMATDPEAPQPLPQSPPADAALEGGRPDPPRPDGSSAVPVLPLAHRRLQMISLLSSDIHNPESARTDNNIPSAKSLRLRDRLADLSVQPSSPVSADSTPVHTSGAPSPRGASPTSLLRGFRFGAPLSPASRRGSLSPGVLVLTPSTSQGSPRGFKYLCFEDGAWHASCPHCQTSPQRKPSANKLLVLDCGCSLCDACCADLLRDGAVPCPLCGQGTDVRDRGVAGLRPNYALEDLCTVRTDLLAAHRDTLVVLDEIGACCPVCLNAYGEVFVPCVLSCGHSLCCRCVKAAGSVCPQCRAALQGGDEAGRTAVNKPLLEALHGLVSMKRTMTEAPPGSPRSPRSRARSAGARVRPVSRDPPALEHATGGGWRLAAGGLAVGGGPPAGGCRADGA